MILVLNISGTTKVLLSQLRLKENSPTNPRIKGSVFSFYSAQVYISFENGFIYKTFAAFLLVNGYSTLINISSIEVDGFHPITHGGFFELIQRYSCFLSINNSSFRNGNNNGTGGVVSIIAPNFALTIENSIFQNISNFGWGGVVSISQLFWKGYLQSSNQSKKFLPLLRITNSSFSYCSSRNHGGVAFVSAQKLSAIIRDSSFLRNSAALSGGALYLDTKDMTEIILYNNYFLENSADDGGIVHALSLFKDSVFHLSVTNVMFVRNKLCEFSAQKDCVYYAVVFLVVRNPKITVNFKNSHFIRNSAVNSSCISISCDQYLSNSVIIDTCIFRENVGSGIVWVSGETLYTCKNSIFVLNSGIPHRSVMVLGLSNSLISIANTRFLNNLCSALSVFLNGTSALTISDSSFVRNMNKYSAGGALLISSEQNSSKTYVNTRIERVLFQENVAAVGSVLYIISSKVLFKKCTFLNNFARFRGGQIVSYGPDSANFLLMHSVFRQTIQKFSTDDNTNEFSATSFLILLSTHTLTVLNTTFDQSTKLNEPLILVPTAYQISFDNDSISTCQLGNAIQKSLYSYAVNNLRPVTSLTVSCRECEYNFYSLQRGKARALNIDSSFKCTPCPRGADCVPAIKSKKNIWGYNASSNPPKLAFTICPFGYCKSPQANSTEYNACQGKRTGVMCGMCSRGYTEAIWSTYCSPVEDCNDHWFWILFVALVVSMAVLLIFKPPLVKYSLQQIFWFKRFTSRRSAHSEAYHDLIQSLSVDKSITQQNI